MKELFHTRKTKLWSAEGCFEFKNWNMSALKESPQDFSQTRSLSKPVMKDSKSCMGVAVNITFTLFSWQLADLL